MSEYNIQMNKYNASNAGYDQLYPQPMKHASTHAKDGNDPITPSMIGTYNKTEIDTALQKKADSSSVYTKSESISAETRTALSLSETATPDAALAEIARQLSERITLLWENASPTSSFAAQSITLDLSSYSFVIVTIKRATGLSGLASWIFEVGGSSSIFVFTTDTNWQARGRSVSILRSGVAFGQGKYYQGSFSPASSSDDSMAVPYRIFGVKA